MHRRCVMMWLMVLLVWLEASFSSSSCNIKGSWTCFNPPATHNESCIFHIGNTNVSFTRYENPTDNIDNKNMKSFSSSTSSFFVIPTLALGSWGSALGIVDWSTMSVTLSIDGQAGTPGTYSNIIGTIVCGSDVYSNPTQIYWKNTTFSNPMSYKPNIGMQWRLLPNVDTVHVVQMNHLDVGYGAWGGVIPNDAGFVNTIVNLYFHSHFPRSIYLSDTMRQMSNMFKNHEIFIYTQHAWLIDLYLHCPKNFSLFNETIQCPNDEEINAMKQAITRGDIT